MSASAAAELEEGNQPFIDFGKLAKVAGGGHEVVPVVLQDVEDGEVLFVGYANDVALRETLKSGAAVLWSTSRKELWRKGATSGDQLQLVDVRVNCEQNSLLYRVRRAKGGACHTFGADGRTRRTCYYRRVVEEGTLEFVEGFEPAP